MRTSGWLTSAAPTSWPYPVTMFTAPAGNPASTINSPSRNVVSEVSSEGFSTTVQPNAIAGAIFWIAWPIGKFHGVIPATTPTGRRSV
ncbi:Uncharacterised protein [Sphingomonas paucimobilis]|nr:Uncharacterised protein [Sphingomonas paucimobilis]